MVVLGQRVCNRAKVVEFGQSGGIQAKWLYLGKSGSIRAKWLYSGKMVFFGQGYCNWSKLFIREKVVVIGESGCIPAKEVVL